MDGPVDSLPGRTADLYQRLLTFHSTALLAYLQFAVAGFSFDERKNAVFCESCGLTVTEDCKDPFVHHWQRSTGCRFFNKAASSTSGSPPPRVPGEGSFAPDAHLSSNSEHSRSEISGGAKHPEYEHESARLATFQGWPLESVRQYPDYLAKCGFFYIGSADRVRCFFCGITLRNWEAEDDPYIEHKNWAPRCTFIQTLPQPNRHSSTIPVPTPTRTPTPTSTLPPTLSAGGQATAGSAATPGGGERKHDVILEVPVVQAVVSMGFAPEVVEKVWRETRPSDGSQALNAAELLVAVESYLQPRSD